MLKLTEPSKERFDLKRIATIEHKDDIHSISNKWADCTSETVNRLMDEGKDLEKRSIANITTLGLSIV